MIGIDLKPELQEMIELISQKNSYSGNKISDSIMKQFSIEITELHDGILVPYWLSVVEHGRGPRKSSTPANVDSSANFYFGKGLWKVIFTWMQKHSMFKSHTQRGKIAEAKQLTWYINKYGTKQFRSKAFVDVYTSVRVQTIEKINKKFSQHIGKITSEIL
jgi:hypothetical protein